MAQLLVHIDADLKRRLKARLAQEGKTFRSWVEDMARNYLARVKISAAPPASRSSRPSSPHPQAGAPAPTRTPQPYNVEED